MSLPKSGFIRLSRKFFSHPFWKEERTHSLAEAWLDLIASARFEVAPEMIIVKVKTVTINRGELRASQRYLSGRWNWSVGKVNRFLNLLEDQSMIERRCEHSETIIIVSNYEAYNPVGDVLDEHQNEHARNESCNGFKTQIESNREHQREHFKPPETLTKPGIQEPGDLKDEHKMNANGYTNGTPTEHQRIQTKESKEGKELLLSKIQKEFYDSLIPFLKTFDKETIRAFYDYWSEPNKSRTKIRMQLEKTWDTKKRLHRWEANGYGSFKEKSPEPEKLIYKPKP